jgi:hypothetical protein
MNDLIFRKQLQVNPQHLEAELLAYLEEYPAQKQVVKRVRKFEKQIEEVLDVEVPEGLHARILLNQSYQDYKGGIESSAESTAPVEIKEALVDEHPEVKADKSPPFWSMRKRISWIGLSAMAASLMVVAVSISLWQAPATFKQVNGSEMVTHILDHIGEDPTLMTAIKLPKTETDMQALFAKVGAHLNQPIEQMSYAGECVVEGQKGLHIVMQDAQGPVTVIVMPGQQLEAMQAFEASGYHGELIPIKGGVVAIVANTMEQVALAQIRFFEAVRFA